ncbi:alginate lyase family protein [Terrimonas sp. NA20]|uniref:Alginate lyase family protein n=1 Tax=Terrimonas ginsenosidimutans TaxID=2908004 RepID=A0ABS9L055_9BACT|nr:alginate lyase family protein [Terrimonas ginsenosidimutans]MCG2617980.1 alginate lyase family protein [Terrimonas ginsenosidimutans]
MINKLFLTTLLALMAVCAGAADAATDPPAEQPQVFVLNLKRLAASKAAVNAKQEPALAAFNQLIRDADKALKFGPVSVMEKKNQPPSGDKHDYMSLAPYHWPDPSKPDGLPYIRKDGQTNPEVKEYKDKEYLPGLCESVYTLGLAYYFSGEKLYADHAAKLLRVWFLDTATRMNPHLNYGQAIKGVNTGRGSGLIDTRHFIKLIDGIGLLNGSSSWKQADLDGMKEWFTSFLQWMQTSKVGMNELNAPNNHGAWYDAQRLSIAMFVDSTALAKRIVQNAQARLDKQMDDAGKFPLELERTISLHYTAFVLEAFFNIARVADKLGMNMWSFESPSGKSLKKAFEATQPYISGAKKWDGQQIKPYEFDESYFLLMEGAEHFNCRNCRQDVKNLAGNDAPRLRINLLY